jgi:hypothetical protein
VAILNGRLPLSMLTRVGVNSVGKVMYLRAGAAARTYTLLVRFVALFLGQKLSLADAYRDLAGQRDAYAKSQRGGPSAAYPGTSNHGLALSADFAAPMNNRLSQMHAFARWFFPLLGWYWDGAAWGEAWHWTFKGIPARPVLRRGSRGNIVKLWQAWLRLAGYRDIALDGDFGPVTARRTADYQRANKLVADAIVGPKTWKRAGLS